MRPIAPHSGPRFEVGSGFDVNPVSWRVLRDGGLALRGEPAGSIGPDVEHDALRRWILGNLVGYWAQWAEGATRSPSLEFRARPRFSSSSAALSVARMHRTLECGDVVSKDRAATDALEPFGTEWHPLLRDALAYRRRPGVATQRRPLSPFPETHDGSATVTVRRLRAGCG